jgi:hypothetical protein
MNKQRLSGFVLISGFIVLVLGGLIFTPPNLYQERNIDVRMQIVEDFKSQFTIAQIASVVGAAGIAAGYLLLTLHLRGEETALWASLGAAALLLGNISLAILMLTAIPDPRAYLGRNAVEGSALSIFDQGFTWLTIAGYFLYGIVFLRGDFPRWLAYFTLGFIFLVLIAALFIATAAVEIIFLMPLVVGIALLRRSKAK